ncbi:MAG: ElyC/SanA/YdcF family protein [bacterium]|nr:ElyC/SanA/YdcF family protein [bacterium]
MGAQGITIIVPIAWKLDRDEHGTIICGAGTREACDHAVKIAQKTPSSLILLTPTNAGADWEHEAMCKVMAGYIKVQAPDIPQTISQAPWFNTMGEVTAAASYIARCKQEVPVKKVIFVVKSWHLRRLRMIARVIFKGRNLDVPVEYATHSVHAPILDRTIRELGAFVFNSLHLRHIGYH